MKFETKITFKGGQFSAFYTMISAAVAYYKDRSNTGSDLIVLSPDILTWRILLRVKIRLETLAVKMQSAPKYQVNLKLDDIETTCLTSCIIPTNNNSYNTAVINEVRSAVHRSVHNHVFNMNPGPALITGNTEPKKQSIVNFYEDFEY